MDIPTENLIILLFFCRWIIEQPKMASAGLAELEQAAGILLGPPNLVSADQRGAAERLFLEFRKTKCPYSMCKVSNIEPPMYVYYN